LKILLVKSIDVNEFSIDTVSLKFVLNKFFEKYLILRKLMCFLREVIYREFQTRIENIFTKSLMSFW